MNTLKNIDDTALKKRLDLAKIEVFLVEALLCCETEEEVKIVSKLGPEFISKHLQELEKFTECSCEYDKNGDFSARKLYASAMNQSPRNCFRRYDLIHAYCLKKEIRNEN